MFKKLFGGKKDNSPRTLEHPSELQLNDIITFKPLSPLPEDVQGTSYTVKKIQTYHYSDGSVPEFVLSAPDGSSLTLMCDDEDGVDDVCLSRKLPDSLIETVFDGEQIASLWEEEGGYLDVKEQNEIPASWLAQSYQQSVQEAVAYFYPSDKRKSGVSQYEDDSEELRYHECHGQPDIYALSVEIWEDGTTDFYLQVIVPVSLIDEMWPNG